MVVEREALTTPTARQIDRSPPQDFPVGNDHRGVWGSVDGTHRMELAKFEMQQKRQRELILPSPSELARQYLKRAGHRDQALDEVEPLLREAERQSTFEKQLSGYGHVSSFANPALELSPPG